MKTVYLFLTKSKTLVSRIIDRYTTCEYTHSSISFSDNLDEMYSVGRRYAFLSLPANLKKEYLDKGFYHYFDKTKAGLYSIKVSSESYENMKKYVEELYKNHKKLKYSFIGLFYCKFNKSLIRKNKMFCSQFVCSVLQQAKENLIEIKPELCKPDDFLNIDGIKCLYKGKVYELAELRNENKLQNLTN